MVKIMREYGYRKLLRSAIILALMMRMFCHLFYITEMDFQIFRDTELYIAMIYLCAIFAIYRGITLKDAKAWIFLCVGIISLVIYFRVRNYSIATVGPDYFKYSVSQAVLLTAFVGLLLDSIRHKPYNIKVYLKNPAIIFGCIFSIVFAVTNVWSVIPYVCPTAVILLTQLDDRQRTELTYYFSAASYYAFAKIFTLSLIQNPDRYIGSRYRGSFFNIGSAGTSCAVALMACLYMFFVFRRKKLKAGMISCVLLAIYPCIAIGMMASRSVELGLAFAIGSIFVFLHGKGMKTTYIRLAVSIGVVALTPIGMFGLSKLLVAMAEAGKIDPLNLNYFWGHVYAMAASNGYVEDCIFEPGTFLYALDILSSTRISIFFEKVTWIRFTGFNDYSRTAYNSHNFFLANLVRYGWLGGIPFIGWFLSSIFVFARKVKEKQYMVFAILLFMLMMGSYSTQSLYINCMGGCLLLIVQAFCVDNNNETADV